MTNQNYTHIAVVLDRSGSMMNIKNDAIGGFNQFLQSQKQVPGKCTFTLAQFDDQYEIVHSMRSIHDVPELTGHTYQPRGLTRLLDAIGKTIVEVGNRLREMPENERPGKVVFMVLTDGHENDSREFRNKFSIQEMIKIQQEAYNWQFVFLSSTLDAYDVAGSYGFTLGSTYRMPNTGWGIKQAYGMAANSVSAYRMSTSDSVVFTDKQKEEADEPEPSSGAQTSTTNGKA